MEGHLGLTRLLDSPPAQGQNRVLLSEVNPDILQDHAQVPLRNAEYASFSIGSNRPTLAADAERLGRVGATGRNDKESRNSDRQQSPHFVLHSPSQFLRP
jgi:hypothetical protein